MPASLPESHPHVGNGPSLASRGRSRPRSSPAAGSCASSSHPEPDSRSPSRDDPVFANADSMVLIGSGGEQPHPIVQQPELSDGALSELAQRATGGDPAAIEQLFLQLLPR